MEYRTSSKERKKCHEGIMEYCDEAACPYKKILAVLGKAYTFSILGVLEEQNTARFNRIVDVVRGSPKTITDRLTELVKEGIVKREAFAEIPPRVEYSLTEMGEGLKPVMVALRDWAKEWSPQSSFS
ncbi:MAG: winged helix-turn-helix transcriptional regulator [Candidatus Thorarchaeota archaeon]